MECGGRREGRREREEGREGGRGSLGEKEDGTSPPSQGDPSRPARVWMRRNYNRPPPLQNSVLRPPIRVAVHAKAMMRRLARSTQYRHEYTRTHAHIHTCRREMNRSVFLEQVTRYCGLLNHWESPLVRVVHPL
jgi:hypothetical protein